MELKYTYDANTLLVETGSLKHLLRRLHRFAVNQQVLYYSDRLDRNSKMKTQMKPLSIQRQYWGY